MIQGLDKILKLGTFESLNFDDLLPSVIKVLGVPDGQFRFEASEVLKYGDLQLFFESGLLVKIILSFVHPVVIRSNHACVEISSKSTVEEFIDVCDALEVSWSINQTLTFDRQLCLSTNARTNVFFDLDRRELSRIQLSR